MDYARLKARVSNLAKANIAEVDEVVRARLRDAFALPTGGPATTGKWAVHHDSRRPSATPTGPASMTLAPVIKQAIRIRAFERKLLELFAEDAVSGTVHTCIGQELCATALAPHLDIGRDAFVATHRGHGPLPRTGRTARMRCLPSSWVGKGPFVAAAAAPNTCPTEATSAAACRAVRRHWRSASAGRESLAARTQSPLHKSVTARLERAALYEAMTFAALWSAPVLFLVEYNGIAMTTDVATTTPGRSREAYRGFRFGIRPPFGHGSGVRCAPTWAKWFHGCDPVSRSCRSSTPVDWQPTAKGTIHGRPSSSLP